MSEQEYPPRKPNDYARPNGSNNRPKVEVLEELLVNAGNFVKLQCIRARYQTKIGELNSEIAKVDRVLIKFADWMESEAKRIRQKAK
jgi:hypothetical protein